MIDFFAPEDSKCACVTSPRFYLYDDEETRPAYLQEEQTRKDSTPVINDCGGTVVFRPVDHVLYPEDAQTHCDVFLHDGDRKCLCFVEMKCVNGDWIAGAVEQLRQTIEDFKAAHPDAAAAAGHRRAIAANTKHPHFKYAEVARMRDFWNRTRFILYLENLVRMD